MFWLKSLFFPTLCERCYVARMAGAVGIGAAFGAVSHYGLALTVAALLFAIAFVAAFVMPGLD